MLCNEFVGNMPLFKESVSEVLSFQVIFTKLFINKKKGHHLQFIFKILIKRQILKFFLVKKYISYSLNHLQVWELQIVRHLGEFQDFVSFFTLYL